MIHNQLSIDNQNNFFNIQRIGHDPKIIVEYNGTGIHNITGPVPVVDISYSLNSNNNNLVDTLVTSINLNGKILRHPEGSNIGGVDLDLAMPGFSGVIAGVSGLKNLFGVCSHGTLVFKCGSNILYEASGLRVTNLQFDNTEDNWTQTADYSISLESSESLFADQEEKYITDRQDSWSIEPLDDMVYTNFNIDTTAKREHSNPLLGRGSSNNIATQQSNTTTEDISLQVLNIPQFRITRRLSAKGLLPSEDRICNTDLYNMNTKPYVFAKAWVEKMTLKGFSSSSPSGSSPYFLNPFVNNLFAFNHNRTINIDIYNGTYEINDTWLAMPSGVPYTETYSIEASSGEDYIKTVRVAGNIIGLSITNQGLMTNSGVLPSGSGTNGTIDAKIDLSAYSNNGQANSTTYETLDHATTSNRTTISSNTKPPPNTIETTRYMNALNAWQNHIKPYLYRRASIVINSKDRTLEYIPSYSTSPPVAPNNPIYSKETLLSTIPVSTSEGHDTRKGTISYSYEYSSRLTVISGVISENISVNYDNPTDSTSEVAVIGRALGPILQRTGRSTPKKTISVEIGIPPVRDIEQISMNNIKCPLNKNGYLFQTIEKIIEAHRPYSPSTFFNEPIHTEGLVYTSSDSESWSPTTGKYSRNVSWVYQQASLEKDFRDH